MNDGGPAFPTEQGHIPEGTWNQTYEQGMSLRDYFAAHAPENLLGDLVPTAKDAAELLGIPADEYDCDRDYVKVNAIVRYRYADAMLEARGAKRRDKADRLAKGVQS